ncbi:hypothetical protein P9H08_14480 [Bacillus cereus]|nr:hypothetical protein [Bacillus cereus]MED3312907.1 hypothetical protein [Bacillus thuringiensis]
MSMNDPSNEINSFSVFGIPISPDDITLNSDGTIEIKNPEVTKKVKQVHADTIKDLFKLSSMADNNILGICIHL